MTTLATPMEVSSMTAAEQAEIEASLFAPSRLYEPFVGKTGIHGAQHELQGFVSLLNRSDDPIRCIYGDHLHTWSYDPSDRVIYWTDTMLGHKVARWKAAYTAAHEYGHDAYTTPYDVPREVIAAHDRYGFHRMMNAAEDPRMERCLTADIPAFAVVATISHRWSFDQQLQKIREGGIQYMPLANQVLLGLMAHVWDGDEVYAQMTPEAQRLIDDSVNDYVEAVAADTTGDMVPAMYRIWKRLHDHENPPSEDDDQTGEGDPTEGAGESDQTAEGDGDPTDGDGNAEGESDGDPADGDAEGDATGKSPAVSDGSDGAKSDEGEGSGDGDAEGDDEFSDGDGKPTDGKPSDDGGDGESADGAGNPTSSGERDTPRGDPTDEGQWEEAERRDRQNAAKQTDDLRRDCVSKREIRNGSDPVAYGNVSGEVRNDSLRLMRGLRRVLADNAVGSFRRNEKSGRVVPGVAHRLKVGRTDIFRQREDQAGTTDWSVVLLVDHSWSTNGYLCEELRKCAVTVIDAVCRVNGVDLAVAGYGEGLHYAIPFGTSRTDVGSSVAANLSHYVGTDEATALEWAIAQSLRRGADGQIILVLTDGQPNEPQLATLLAEQARHYGILTAGIGVNHPAPGYHPVARTASTDDLPVVVPEVIKSMMRGRS